MEAVINAKNLEISTKKSIEIANFIRKKNIEQAKKTLQRVIEMKQGLWQGVIQSKHARQSYSY